MISQLNCPRAGQSDPVQLSVPACFSEVGPRFKDALSQGVEAGSVVVHS